MLTKYNNLMFSRFHLAEMEYLPSKKYKAIMTAVIHHFYDEEEPDFSRFTDTPRLKALYTKMVNYISEGIRRYDESKSV